MVSGIKRITRSVVAGTAVGAALALPLVGAGAAFGAYYWWNYSLARVLSAEDEKESGAIVNTFELSSLSRDEPDSFEALCKQGEEAKWPIVQQVVDAVRLKVGLLENNKANRLVVEREARKVVEKLGDKGLRRSVGLRILPYVPVAYFIRTRDQINADKLESCGTYQENQTTGRWRGGRSVHNDHTWTTPKGALDPLCWVPTLNRPIRWPVESTP
jgi:hypothetical protein